MIQKMAIRRSCDRYCRCCDTRAGLVWIPTQIRRQVITVDFDGDGDVDLLAASRDSGRLLWYENLLPAATPSPIDDSATSLVDETTNSADASGITPANDSDTTSSAADSTDGERQAYHCLCP